MPTKNRRYFIYRSEKMANEQKIKLIKWIEFGITCITILAKFIKEVVEIIPEKN